LIVQRLLATRRSGGIFLSMRGEFRGFTFFRALALGALLLGGPGRIPAQDSNAVAGGDLFTNAAPYLITITISPENIASLRTDPRKHVLATIREGTNVVAQAGIHLKGSIGSFRKIDDKPAFTISFDKFVAGQRFHGLLRIHLNNSVEDPTYMNELVGGELFRAAGVPTPRAGHALVELNGRKLGLYVLKEGFTEDFLALHFRHPNGDLYEPALDAHDVHEPLEKALGRRPEDRSNLEVFAAAATEPNLARRWQRLQGILDMDRFISFMALEILLGHRDGYCLARNNFRIYHDVDSGRMLFMPHGMDQLFGNARATIAPHMNGLAARAVLETPQGRLAYRERCAALLTNSLDTRKVAIRIDQVLAGVRPVLSVEDASALDRECAGLKERIAARWQDATKQLVQAFLEPLRFTNNVGLPSNWQAVDVPEGGRVEQIISPDGKPALAIFAGPITSASWRTKVLLPRGRYLFEGRIRTDGVAPLSFGKNHGAALHVSEFPRPREARLTGTQGWKSFSAPLDVTEDELEVQLVCELRGSKGTAWFEIPSLRVVRLEK
jgi:spore coat protein H